MDPLNVLGIVLGLGVLGLVIAAALRREFDAEAPKYEMLGLSPPTEAPHPQRKPGRVGVEDRVIRLGLVGAAFYYAARLGGTRPGGIVLGLLGIYLLVTGLIGRDPLYRLRGWDTRLPEGRADGSKPNL